MYKLQLLAKYYTFLTQHDSRPYILMIAILFSRNKLKYFYRDTQQCNNLEHNKIFSVHF